MALVAKIRTLFRVFVLLTVLAAVALVSAITTIRFTIRGRQTSAPSVLGMTVDKGESVAAALRLDLRVEDKIYNEQYPAGQILSQVPAPGTSVKIGQHIHVLVSLGPPRVSVPDLTGATLRAAQISTFQRGLTLGDVAKIHWKGATPELVVAQDPPPNSPEVRGPSVNILVSLGEPPAAYVCPNFAGRPVAEARRDVERAGFKIGRVVSVHTPGAASNTILTQSPPAGSKILSDAVFDFQVAQ